jgi:hypothetical protein
MKCCESGFKSVDHFLVHFSDGEHVGGQPVGRGLEDYGPALQVPGVLRHGAPGANVINFLCLYFTNVLNKLECLSLASPSCLV